MNFLFKSIVRDAAINQKIYRTILNLMISVSILCLNNVSEAEKRYRVSDKHEIIKLLILYKPDSQITSLDDTWKDFIWPGIH